MKKTLAAVLAAAMALSTASVAFAADHVTLDGDLIGGSTVDANVIVYGKEYKQYLRTDEFDEYTLGEWLDDNIIKIDAIVTEGRSSLETAPTLSVQNLKTTNSVEDITKKDGYRWLQDIKNKNGSVKYKTGSTASQIPAIYDETTGKWVFTDDLSQEGFVLVGNKNVKWDDVLTSAIEAGAVEKFTNSSISTSKPSSDKAVQVKYKVRHTYGTGDTTIKMKFKITFKKNSPDGNYSKGDTYTTDEMEFKAKYGELNSYSQDMVLTLDEVKPDNGSNVILKGDKLYDEIGNDTFSIQFEDTAVFEAKAASAQKKVNLFYNLDEINEITDTYPNVDFEFITFKGNPSFVNSGTMTFNAIGGKNTTVYTFDGETLNPLTTTYDSSYKTVTAKGIKKLGTFVIASEILEVEDEEDNEPVSSAPVVEEPSSQPSSNDSDRNPATGAC